MFSVFAAAKEHALKSLKKPLKHPASWKVAFGEHGEVVLTDKDNICLYRHNGVEYILDKETRLPDDTRGDWFCNKAVSSSAVFLQHNPPNPPTQQLENQDLGKMGELKHEGLLGGILYPSTLVYRQKIDGGYCINLHQPEKEPVTLKPLPENKKWRGGLSLCRVEDRYIVVVDHNNDSMDVFSPSGNILLLLCHISFPIECVN